MGRFFRKAISMIPPPVRKQLRKLQYNNFAKKHIEFNEVIRYLNLGYNSPEKLNLSDYDEPFRLNIQLYHELIKDIELSGKNVLEIGCGFGGGCYYMATYFKPVSVTGIDISYKNIDMCNRLHKVPNTQYLERDAEHTQLPGESFDI